VASRPQGPRVGAKPPPQYTEVFGAALVEEARRDPRVIGITAAMAGGTGLSKLAAELPDQYFDVGIAEQHAVLFAAGLALEGVRLPAEPELVRIGTGETLVEGERVALVGYGAGVEIALGAAGVLRTSGIEPTVCDARFAKPLDAELLSSLAARHELLVLVEEN